MIRQRVETLRKYMREAGIDIYLIPTSDFHESEYVGGHFKAREFMSGFTGSAGTLVVTQTQAGLWTDGRYFIQAEAQLKNSGIDLYKMGMKDVLSVEDFVIENIPEEGKLGIDGRVINSRLGIKLEERLKEKNASISYNRDIVDEIWEDRPALSCEPAFLLDIQYAGKSRKEKLEGLRKKLEEEKADVFILTCLDDIAWLFNIRGNDIPYNPVVLSYVIITKEKGYFFVNEGVLNTEIKEAFQVDQIEIMPYDAIYDFVKQFSGTDVVLLDKGKVNYAIIRNLNPDIKIIDKVNPTTLAKAVKNEVELENLRKSHLKDAVAVTKFMYWLKTKVGKEEITEITASDYLENLRREQEGFIELSFDTICAYQEHAAMMHYSASKETDVSLKPEGLLLVDSGGQYYEGTTDITRTFVLGSIEEEWKKHFTLVVKSMLNLANAKFLYGCTGLNLDILARGPLWNLGIDYRCGTGHGVGYLLNVHEAPNGFRWKHVPERNDQAILEAGMVTTDEPGVYIEGSHGIRIENELICKKAEENEYGQFMNFEMLTYVPIDLDGIDKQYLNSTDIEQINRYHQMVYEKVSPYLNSEEREWLQTYTREI
ncbi:MAG: aminopeptidase P family protein [Lachnospiraceae bacterium]|nr:aminopeptidase P family protein [Lachnospiraceae bacterium]